MQLNLHEALDVQRSAKLNTTQLGLQSSGQAGAWARLGLGKV
jgi:hypothetical protein